MTNRIYTNEKTCPLCHKNKAMFTLSLEGEKIQICPTCYQIVKIESDRHKTKNIINDPKYTLDRIYQMLSASVIEQNHAMQQIALTIYKHIQQKELIRTNALIVGPTGSGKTEVARQVEKYCGKDYPVLYRMSAVEYVPGGLEIEESKILARLVEEAGADCIHCSQGVYASTYVIIPPSVVPRAAYVENAAEIKKVVDIPVIAVGRINDVEIAESVLQADKADLVTMARASLIKETN